MDANDIKCGKQCKRALWRPTDTARHCECNLYRVIKICVHLYQIYSQPLQVGSSQNVLQWVRVPGTHTVYFSAMKHHHTPKGHGKFIISQGKKSTAEGYMVHNFKSGKVRTTEKQQQRHWEEGTDRNELCCRRTSEGHPHTMVNNAIGKKPLAP